MTRDIDFVIALLLKDLEALSQIFGDEFYFSPEAARQGNPKVKGNSPMWKISSPQVPTWNT
jgi:hypothetical protein